MTFTHEPSFDFNPTAAALPIPPELLPLWEFLVADEEEDE